MRKDDQRLTKKQEKFVEELIKGKSQREAYKTAFNAENMKDETIDSKACLLYKKDKIRARYNGLMDKAIASGEVESIEVRRRIISQLMKILQADVKLFFSFTETEDGNARMFLKDLTDIDTSAVQSISQDKDEKTTIKLYDKLSAIKELIEIFRLTEDSSESTKLVVELGEELKKYIN